MTPHREFADLLPEDPSGDAPASGADPLQRLRSAVELAFVAAAGDVTGADGEVHAFEVDFDGDGWTEPFSVHARCSCRDWSRTWAQSDRAQSDRPAVADLLLAWVAHHEGLPAA